MLQFGEVESSDNWQEGRRMGIKNLKVQSKALRMKWLWKFANENQMLWKRVISAEYEGEVMLMTKEVTTTYGLSL